MSWLRRLRNRGRQEELAREFDAELQFHLDRRTEANIRRGIAPDEAAVEARRHFGNVTRAREEMRAARVATWLDGVGNDLRYAVRVFARHPAITALTILMLSLGIGANTAVFSMFEAVLLRPLPYPDAERLVLLLESDGGGRGLTTPTVPEVLDLRKFTRSFDAVTFFDTRDFQTTGGDEPQRVIGARVEASFLATLGARASLGRIFGAADGAVPDHSIVLLGYGFWQRNFGSDPQAIGRTLSINGEPYEIVGVLSETFSVGQYLAPAIDVYFPYPSSPEYTSRTGQFANVRRVAALARLGPGVSLAAASAELRTTAAAIAAAHPDLYGRSGLSMLAQPVREALTRNSRPLLLLLFGVVAVILLIACVNTAQFLLAQALEREPEIAVRRALGASRSRLVRQCLSEVLLLTAATGVAGLAQAVWLTNVLRALVPPWTPIVGRIAVDGAALVFLVAVTLICSAACALVPVVRFSAADRAERVDIRTGTQSGRLRHAFIATEVALSVVLLIGAALLVRSLQELQRAQSGFSSDRVTVLRLRGMSGGPALGDHYARYLTQLATVKGIDAIGMTNSVFPGRPGVSFAIAGDPTDTAALSRQQASYQIVSGGYFTALGIPLEAGRLFTDDDNAARPRVAIVNREMAQRFWRDGNPIGRQIRAGEGPRDATMTIVGIVGNVRPPFQVGDVPQMYVPYRQQSEPNMAVVVRTAPGVLLPLAAIKHAIWTVEPRQAVFGVETLDAQLSRAVSSQHALAVLTTGFAALALVISVCGIYMVVAYLVRRRFKEIAVRRAIGATGRDVLWSLGGSTLRWTAVGLLAGAAAATAATRALRAAVAGIIPLDATLTSLVATTYLLIVLLVIAASARMALRIDPAAALRAE